MINNATKNIGAFVNNYPEQDEICLEHAHCSNNESI